jgi:AraC-like DNA-binding protein
MILRKKHTTNYLKQDCGRVFSRFYYCAIGSNFVNEQIHFPHLLFMALQLFNADNRALMMQQGLPFPYKGAALSGSYVQHHTWETGQVILQEINQLQYTIRYAVYKMARQIKLKFVRPESGLQTTAILNDQCRTTIAGAGRFRIEEGYFSTLFSNSCNGTLQFEQGTELIAFDTTWSIDMLHAFIPEDSEWWKIFEKDTSDIPVLIGSPYRRITPALAALIEQIKYSSYEPALRSISIDHLLKEYLTEILKEAENHDWLDGDITKNDLERIEAAKEIIAANPNNHISTSALAKMVYMNECKLKALFVKATGMGIFDYMMYLRCCAVKERIVNTDLPLKAFVQEAGYSDLANFVTGFKRHMGCTPADIRKYA